MTLPPRYLVANAASSNFSGSGIAGEVDMCRRLGVLTLERREGIYGAFEAYLLLRDRCIRNIVNTTKGFLQGEQSIMGIPVELRQVARINENGAELGAQSHDVVSASYTDLRGAVLLIQAEARVLSLHRS